MSFKIIQELSKKGFVLAIIPEALEENGVVWYPPLSWSSKKRNCIIKNPYAQPDKKLWLARPCRVKKNKIKMYSIAEQIEEELLSKNVTTEDDRCESDDSIITPTNNRIKHLNATRSPQPNFDMIAETMNAVSIPVTTSKTTGINETVSDEPIIGGVARTYRINSSITQPYEILDSIILPTITVLQENLNMETISSGQSDGVTSPTTDVTHIMVQLLDNQRKILSNQDEIKNSINVSFSKLFTQIENLVKVGVMELSVNNNDTTRNTQFTIENLKKISTVEEANSLETLLTSEENMALMVAQMGYVVGKTGRRSSEGWTCCYELVDSIFYRSFLVQCSWTGGSKSKEDGKVKFLSFKNIIRCFAKIIIATDPTFSVAAIQQFFKSLLRNATRFHIQEKCQKRKSTARNRRKKENQKKPKLTELQESDTSEEQIDDESTANLEGCDPEKEESNSVVAEDLNLSL